MVSVILPVYNEEENVAPLVSELVAELGDIDYEIVAVDDGSTDGSLAELKRLQVLHPLRVIVMERHSGQSATFQAGFDAARGEVVVTMDADGQNDPADVPRLLALIEAEPTCAAVVGYRVRRADSGWKRVQSGVANSVRNWLTGDRIRDTGCSLRVMRREFVMALPKFNGMHRFYPTLIRRQGGIVIETPVSHRPRRSGKSKYGMSNRLLVALRDAFGVRWLRRRTLQYRATEEGRS